MRDDWLNHRMVRYIDRDVFESIDDGAIHIAFNHIVLAKGFYLVEVVLVHLPLIKLWEAPMNEVIN